VYLAGQVGGQLARTRRGLKWGLPVMLLTVPYFAIANWCTTLIDHGAPGWLYPIVLICL
jgi:hypothetical protein